MNGDYQELSQNWKSEPPTFDLLARLQTAQERAVHQQDFETAIILRDAREEVKETLEKPLDPLEQAIFEFALSIGRAPYRLNSEPKEEFLRETWITSEAHKRLAELRSTTLVPPFQIGEEVICGLLARDPQIKPGTSRHVVELRYHARGWSILVEDANNPYGQGEFSSPPQKM